MNHKDHMDPCKGRESSYTRGQKVVKVWCAKASVALYFSSHTSMFLRKKNISEMLGVVVVGVGVRQ